MAIPRICSIPDCGKAAVNKHGWCNAHYLRWRRHGNPTGGNPRDGRSSDIVGKTFGRLTVIARAPKIHPKIAHFICRCVCGEETIVASAKLRSGKTRSCGCLSSDTTTIRNRTHGDRRHPLYGVWANIKTRCLNPKNAAFRNYGGRGITMCDEWRHSFPAFRDWGLSNGYRAGLEIDRINNDAGYEPANCRWVPRSVQARNKRNVRAVIRSDGAAFPSIAEAAIVTGTPSRDIQAACSGRQKQAGGFVWNYVTASAG